MELEIKQLDENLIHRANNNSMFGTRGDLSAESYKSYIDENGYFYVQDDEVGIYPIVRNKKY